MRTTYPANGSAKLKFLALALLCAGPVLSQAPGNRPFNQSTQGYPPSIPIKGSAFFSNAVVYTDGQGFLETVTGLGTNCVLVSGGSGACGGLLFGTLAAIPVTCSVGSTLYQATDQPVGQQMYACTSTNTWTKVVAGALQASLNLSDLGNVATARSNLGLGAAATQSLAAFLQPSNNLSDVSSASTARANLGLGAAAVQNVGTSGANLGLLSANLTFAGVNAYGTPASIDLLHATDLPAASVNAGALANGMTATTQSPGDNTTKVATDAFVLANAGSPPQLTSVGYSASLTLTATSSTLSEWIIGTLTGNLSITFSGLTSGQLVGVEVVQDGTGGRTVAVTSPGGWATIYVNPTASTTTDLFFKIDASGIGHCLNCTTGGIGVESAMPSGNPVSGTEFSLFDSTAHFPRVKNSAGTIFQMSKELASGSVRCAGGAGAVDAALTLTTTGSSGAATLSGCGLNIPQYTGGGGGSSTLTYDYPAAGCTPGGTSFVLWWQAATADCFGSTSLGNIGEMQIAGGSTVTLGIIHVAVPSGWTSGGVALTLMNADATPSLTKTYSVQTACITSSTDIYAGVTFNAAQTVNWTSQAFANLTYTTISSLTMTGCSAGNLLAVRVQRTDANSDNEYFFGAQMKFSIP